MLPALTVARGPTSSPSCSFLTCRPREGRQARLDGRSLSSLGTCLACKRVCVLLGARPAGDAQGPPRDPDLSCAPGQTRELASGRCPCVAWERRLRRHRGPRVYSHATDSGVHMHTRRGKSFRARTHRACLREESSARSRADERTEGSTGPGTRDGCGEDSAPGPALWGLPAPRRSLLPGTRLQPAQPPPLPPHTHDATMHCRPSCGPQASPILTSWPVRPLLFLKLPVL